MSDRVFISNNLAGERMWGKEQDSGETERKESVRDRTLLERRGSVGNKIDH
jgi:hypothetical protein